MPYSKVPWTRKQVISYGMSSACMKWRGLTSEAPWRRGGAAGSAMFLQQPGVDIRSLL